MIGCLLPFIANEIMSTYIPAARSRRDCFRQRRRPVS